MTATNKKSRPAIRARLEIMPTPMPVAPRASDRQVGGSHYKDMPVAPWEAMEAWMPPAELRGYHKGVAIGYLAREGAKGGDEDIAKASHHLQRLVELIEEGRA